MTDTAHQITVEAITLDEAAVRCRLTRETFAKHYDGPVVPIGREKRVMVEHLNDWLKRLACTSTSTHSNATWGKFE